MLVWIPDEVGEHLLGPLPEGVELELWTGENDPPDSLDRVEFFVPPVKSKASIALLTRMPRLRVVQLTSAGAEWIAGQVPDGVTLCNAKGAHTDATAEWTVTAILAQLRSIPSFLDAQREGVWRFHPTDELWRKRVLIVGYGSIGRAVEARLLPFGCTVERVARHAREDVAAMDELPRLLADADVVVLLLPFTEQTRGLLGEEFLAGMKDGALLVNASRGGVLDTDALVRHLQQGRLTAALDVVDPEPLPEGHPLWEAPGLLLTPHVAGSTSTIMARCYATVRRQLDRYVRGEPLQNVIVDGY
jgi:phosphoglycerate dehydrogenase-like enzyme